MLSFVYKLQLVRLLHRRRFMCEDAFDIGVKYMEKTLIVR